MAGITAAIVASSQVADDCLDVIDRKTEPPMSKEQAKEVLEDIIERCRGRIEALEDEMAADD